MGTETTYTRVERTDNNTGGGVALHWCSERYQQKGLTGENLQEKRFIPTPVFRCACRSWRAPPPPPPRAPSPPSPRRPFRPFALARITRRRAYTLSRFPPVDHEKLLERERTRLAFRNCCHNALALSQLTRDPTCYCLHTARLRRYIIAFDPF